MFILKRIGNAPNILLQKFVCDVIADLENIKEAQFGAECYVIDTKETYIKNSLGEWKLKFGNSDGSDSVDPELSAGLYVDGKMTKSWEDLVSENIIRFARPGSIVSNTKDAVIGDLVVSNDVNGIYYEGFYGCKNLTSINMPMVTEIGEQAFEGCIGLTSIDLPKVTRIGLRTFFSCTNLTSINMPAVTTIEQGAFHSCTNLTLVNMPVIERLESQAFGSCTSLDTIILRKADSIVDVNIIAFADTKILTDYFLPTGQGFIYIPTHLYEDYVSNFIDQMLELGSITGIEIDAETAESTSRAILRKIEEYPEICG